MNPAARPQEQPQRVVFGSGFEALLTPEVRRRMSPALAEELKKIGVQIDRPFHPAYTAETFARTLELVAADLHPDLPPSRSHYLLGRATVHGFGTTLVGRALFQVLRLIGPHRAVERAARSYANTNNYARARLTRVGPTAYEMHLNELHTIPEYDLGVCEQMLELIGAVQPSATLVSRDAEGFTMLLQWKAD